MSSVGYGAFHYGISNYGSPQYEQASCTITANSGSSVVPSLIFAIVSQNINAQSGLSGALNTKFQTTSVFGGVSNSTQVGTKVFLGTPNEMLENSGSLVHGTQIDQAETYIQVNSGATSVGNQIDQGASTINATSGTSQIGTLIDLGESAFTETSSTTNIGTQIDLGILNPIAVSQVVSVGTQIDLSGNVTINGVANLNSEAVFRIAGSGNISANSELVSNGVRTYFASSIFTPTSGVSSIGGIKWTDQVVDPDTWTEQNADSITWAEQTNPTTTWTQQKLAE